MKKIFVTLLAIILFCSTAVTLVACTPPQSEDGSSATSIEGLDAIRLLLANERLNSALLKNEGDIFEDGAEVLRGLASEAQEQFNAIALSNVTPLAVQDGQFGCTDGSSLTINGETYVWRNFAEYSNSHDYFENITGNIVFSANMGAELIDNVKKHVRVLDMWVDQGTQLYLHVEENSETLFSRTEELDLIEMCRRYKNEAGTNTYETYSHSVGAEGMITDTRMLYIPGMRYEYTTKMRRASDQYTYDVSYVADNSKGYWEIFDASNLDGEHTTLSIMMMKDDVCYDAFYNPHKNTVNLLKVVSPDKKTDIMFFYDAETSSTASIRLQGFDGIDRVELYAPEEYRADKYPYDGEKWVIYDPGNPDRIASTTGNKYPTVYTKKGIAIKNGDVFMDGNITIGASHISANYKMNGTYGYVGDMDIVVRGDTYNERIEILKEFLDQVGLTCRRDIDDIFVGITTAYRELEAFTSYYKWNGLSINRLSDVEEGVEKEWEKLDAMHAEYTAVKDAKVIDSSDMEAMELNMHFAQIVQLSENIVYDSGKISLGGVKLSVDDTLLFVEEEPYVVAFALLDTKEGSLVHLTYEAPPATPYTGADTFEISADGITVDVPKNLEFGEYRLVAYVSTEDGIRSSGYVALPATVQAGAELRTGENIILTASNDQSGALLLTFKETTEIAVTLELEKAPTYEELYELLGQEIYGYGIIKEGAVIEQNVNGTYVSIAPTNEEPVVGAGNYRIAYENKNGDSVIADYAYLTFVITAS